MRKIFKLFIIAFVVIAFPLSVEAALTVGSTSVVSDGALTLNGAVGSNVLFGTTATTGSISMGTALTTGTYTVGGTSQTGAITIGSSTQSQNINIGYGSTLATGQTQTIRIGGNGAVNSNQYIYIGTQSSGGDSDVILDIAGATSLIDTGDTTIGIGNNGSTGSTVLTLGRTSGNSITYIQGGTSTSGSGIKMTGQFSHNYGDAPISFSADRTITALEIMKNRIFVHPSSDDNPRVITTDSASNIKNRMPGGGGGQYDVFTFLVSNQAGSAGSVLTFIGGSGVTIDSNVTVPAKTSRVIYCQIGVGSSAICY